MPSILWKGRVSLPMRIMVNANCLLAWALGTTRDRAAMKQRVKMGYNGGWTDDGTRYDETGLTHFSRTSEALLDVVEVRGKTVLDVGCGTGIASSLALERGAARVLGADLAEGMVAVAQAKARERRLDETRLQFRQADADALPYPDNAFDVVISGLMLEFAPNPLRTLAEMVRVLAPSGHIAVSTHGLEYYWEAIDATFWSIGKRHLLGYRPEVWQYTEAEMRRPLVAAGLEDVRCSQAKWREEFASGDDAFAFWVATSSGFWASNIPAETRGRELARVRNYFGRKPVKHITSDIVLGTARKPTAS